MKRSKKSKNNETKSMQQNREQLKEEGGWAGGGVGVWGGGRVTSKKKLGKQRTKINGKPEYKRHKQIKDNTKVQQKGKKE